MEMNNNIVEYTTLSACAKVAGGPSNYVKKCWDKGFQCGYDQGIKEGIGIGWSQRLVFVNFVLSTAMTVGVLAYLVHRARKRKEAKHVRYQA